MNAFNAANAYDFAPHWNAQELTDAVPLRLHQLIDFNHDGERAVSANAAAPKRSCQMVRLFGLRKVAIFALHPR